MKLRYCFHIIPLILVFGVVQAEQLWKPLASDGLHDPESPAIGVLQEPAVALSLLPQDSAGNKVDWIEALREQYIEPRTNIFPETEIKVIDLDIIMAKTGEMPLVRFPHKPHTEWLDCNNCHDRIFIEKVDANPISMFAILNGEFCGVCHGAVSFPLTECNRCHSVTRSSFMGQPGAQPTTSSGTSLVPHSQ
jgi:c(7)-type cytochrome triheme protein